MPFHWISVPLFMISDNLLNSMSDSFSDSMSDGLSDSISDGLYWNSFSNNSTWNIWVSLLFSSKSCCKLTVSCCHHVWFDRNPVVTNNRAKVQLGTTCYCSSKEPLLNHHLLPPKYSNDLQPTCLKSSYSFLSSVASSCPAHIINYPSVSLIPITMSF